MRSWFLIKWTFTILGGFQRYFQPSWSKATRNLERKRISLSHRNDGSNLWLQDLVSALLHRSWDYRELLFDRKWTRNSLSSILDRSFPQQRHHLFRSHSAPIFPHGSFWKPLSAPIGATPWEILQSIEFWLIETKSNHWEPIILGK